ncbi:glycine receptor subunit alpha-2-like [Homarus americanus]|uniref:glycine receptor subunit alpha-2-like n=1 Tax=Homarus americanus TaxID=6706 RepID=UPI001C490871|nr:glycine receptor subunit alpha-2-like [Homarus americanus]
MWVFLWLLLTMVTAQQQQENTPNKVTTAHLRILDSLLRNYDRRATPTNHKNEPTNVTCELYIRSFGSINPTTMDYQVDLYLRQEWEDERLRHPDITNPLDLNDPNLVKAIWKPEVYFPNAKLAEFQFVTVPNVLVRINPNGQILYMLRLKLTFACMMELSRFPLDVQVCTMEIGSFSKTTQELNLSWKEGDPIKIYRGLKMPQFNIIDNQTDRCHEDFQIGNYSCLRALITLERNIGFHLVQSYLPSILIVVISWMGFWMDTDSVPARTCLGVTTLLTVSNQASETQLKIPQVSYIKALDIWMGVCTAFIFAALLEFTVVNYYWRKKLSTACHNPCRPKTTSDSWMELMPNGRGLDQLSQASPAADVAEFSISQADTRRYRLLACRIDELSRYLFPVAFLVFNVAYWWYYMSHRH